MKKLKKGFTHIYTGNGKGKTTAAIGQIIRAAGYGLKSYLACFMKDFPYSEFKALKRLDDLIKIEVFGKDDFVYRKEYPNNDELKEIKKGLEAAKENMLKGEYDIIVLDEIFVCHYFRIFTEEEITNFIRLKPEDVELILTGRYCPKEIYNYADLITEMNEVKHYYTIGINARKGIEA